MQNNPEGSTEHNNSVEDKCWNQTVPELLRTWGVTEAPKAGK